MYFVFFFALHMHIKCLKFHRRVIVTITRWWTQWQVGYLKVCIDCNSVLSMHIVLHESTSTNETAYIYYRCYAVILFVLCKLRYPIHTSYWILWEIKELLAHLTYPAAPMHATHTLASKVANEPWSPTN